MVQHTCGMRQTQGDDSDDVENEDTMNTIRTRIADPLVTARGG